MSTTITGVLGDTTNFTSLQMERFNAIYHIYGPDAALLIPLLKARGENSFQRVYEKAVEVNKAHGSVAEYYMNLTSEFRQYKSLTISKIQQIVCEVRANMELAPYFKQIKTKAINDFMKLFIFEEDFEESEEPTNGALIGYKPLKAIRVD